MRIYLIGYMGCGKSSIGKKLARKLELTFMDLDEYIEEKEGRSIEKIFEKEGESGFRGLEKKYLKRLSKKEDVLVSCGGGTPCFYDNMEVMNKTGLTIYLKMDVGSLVYRLMNSDKKRPLIKGMDELQLSEFIKQHLSERSEFYDSAKMTISSIGFDSRKMEDLSEKIMSYEN